MRPAATAASTTDTVAPAVTGSGTAGGRSSSPRTNHLFIVKSCHHPTNSTACATAVTDSGLFLPTFPPKLDLLLLPRFHPSTATAAPPQPTATTCCWRLRPSLLVRTIVIPKGITSLVNAGDDLLQLLLRRIFSSQPSNRLQCKRCATAVLRR